MGERANRRRDAGDRYPRRRPVECGGTTPLCFKRNGQCQHRPRRACPGGCDDWMPEKSMGREWPPPASCRWGNVLFLRAKEVLMGGGAYFMGSTPDPWSFFLLAGCRCSTPLHRREAGGGVCPEDRSAGRQSWPRRHEAGGGQRS